jgi:ribose 1,5-bisphosphate isomerase
MKKMLIRYADGAPVCPDLPDASRALMDRLEGEETLGASLHIRQINDLLCSIAEEWPTPSGRELTAALLGTGEYLMATRGSNAPAIANSIQLVLRGLESQSGDTVAGVRDFILARREKFNALSIRNAELMAQYGAGLLENCLTLVIFCYSSTTQAILKKLAHDGHTVHLVVPESRALDGGRPVVREASAWGHRVDFVIDLAVCHYLRKADAVLMGAESILANGDCWNTVGCYSMAALAGLFQVPFYVATELIKIDPASFAGRYKSLNLSDYSQILDFPGSFEHPDRISVMAPELDNVPAHLVTGYITQRGVISPQHVWDESARFLEENGIALFPDD